MNRVKSALVFLQTFHKNLFKIGVCLLPNVNNTVIAFFLGNVAALILIIDFQNLFVGLFEHSGLFRRNNHVLHTQSCTEICSVLIADSLELVQKLDSQPRALIFKDILYQFSYFFIV